MAPPSKRTMPSRLDDFSPAPAELHIEPGERVVVPPTRDFTPLSNQVIEVGRVCVTKHVSEHDELVSVPLTGERVRVERVPIGRTVDRLPEVRQEGTTTVVPVIEEVLVLERKILLKEEIRITREPTVARSEPQQIRLRSERVRVEPSPPEAPAPVSRVVGLDGAEHEEPPPTQRAGGTQPFASQAASRGGHAVGDARPAVASPKGPGGWYRRLRRFSSTRSKCLRPSGPLRRGSLGPSRRSRWRSGGRARTTPGTHTQRRRARRSTNRPPRPVDRASPRR